MLNDCFTDEKIDQIKLRNAVTSAKKINPLQIMKDMKSPEASSYISSAKKALVQEDEYDEEPLHFQLSDRIEDTHLQRYYDKENIRSENNNILVERFKGEEITGERENSLKKLINISKVEPYMQETDYNLLDSPDRSHKHSKSRSRTKEKDGNGNDWNRLHQYGDVEDDNASIIQHLDLTNLVPHQHNDKAFLTNVKRKLEGSLSMPKSPEDNMISNDSDIEETSKSLEWIIAKDLDKKQQEQVNKLIGEDDSRPENYEIDNDNDSQILEIEEIKRVHFGNSLIRNNNIGYDTNDNKSNSNLGQYVECLESVESSADNSVRGINEKEILKDKGKVTEYLTDEILSMMLFNDIHDCPMHPIRETNFIDYFKDKYPFNRELGIDTSCEGTNKYIDGLVNYIKQYHMDTILYQLKTPIVIEPLRELRNLQVYDDPYNDAGQDTDRDETESNRSEVEEADNGNILPNELFYEYEQIRKNETYQKAHNDKNDFTDQEIEDKIKYTFIHDKVAFDTFNIALNCFDKRRETLRPWIKQTKAAYDRPYSIQNVLELFSKTKDKVNEWLNISAGTRKTPPPSFFDNFNNYNENMNDTIPPPTSHLSDEERLQQMREEKLSLLLSREIQEEDYKWNEFEPSEIQIKLDLADMVLDTLVCEISNILNSK